MHRAVDSAPARQRDDWTWFIADDWLSSGSRKVRCSVSIARETVCEVATRAYWTRRTVCRHRDYGGRDQSLTNGQSAIVVEHDDAVRYEGVAPPNVQTGGPLGRWMGREAEGSGRPGA